MLLNHNHVRYTYQYALVAIVIAFILDLQGVSCFSFYFCKSQRQQRAGSCVSTIRQKNHESSSFPRTSILKHAASLGNEGNEEVAQFIAHTQRSIQEQTFVSFTLKGLQSSKPKKGRKAYSQEEAAAQNELLRGSIRQVQGRLIQLKKKQTKKRQKSSKDEETEGKRLVLQATLKYHSATDVAQNWSLESNGNMMNSEMEERLWSLFVPSLSSDDDDSSRDTDDGLASEWGRDKLIGGNKMIESAQLIMTEGQWNLGNLASKKKNIGATLVFQKAKANKDTTVVTAPMDHDRVKQVPLDSSDLFLQKLGVSNAKGKPRPGMSSKLRQCQKFVEIVGNLISSFQQDQQSCISVVDMGCGRGYLTFSLHSYLQRMYQHTKDGGSCRVKSRGIDVRPKLVQEMNGIARELGPSFDGLDFCEGTIEHIMTTENDKTTDSTMHHQDGDLNILIALHACDTATDDALWFGIDRQCDIIVTAPCCHKEVRRQLDVHVAGSGKGDNHHPYGDVLRHNIYRERMAETVTDSLRALLLELAHYHVQVFEFIGGEHTSKNVMIAATKLPHPRSDADLMDIQDRIQALAHLHGVSKQRLSTWMGKVVLYPENAENMDDATSPTAKHKKLSPKRMPPLVP